MGRLAGKVAVVTGGANGIGRACCERFAAEGADVVIGDVQAADATTAAVEALGRRAVARHLDAGSPADNDALMRCALDQFGGLDIVVTAAGISHAAYRSGDLANDLARLTNPGRAQLDPARQFADFPIGEWQAVLDVNLTGTFLAVQAAARSMLALGRGGSIITIASIAAKHPEAGPVAYGVSKAGVWMVTKQAAQSLGPAGIRVNAIGPGYIDTNMLAVMKEMPGAVERIVAGLPLRRLGTPLDIANAAVFLASDESSYFTGEILHPDGGFVTD
ncbi:MAG: SDR family NAD(P)-dependent oxidoreductase [Acidimicrobiales bacterium]